MQLVSARVMLNTAAGRSHAANVFPCTKKKPRTGLTISNKFDCSAWMGQNEGSSNQLPNFSAPLQTLSVGSSPDGYETDPKDLENIPFSMPG